MLLTTLTLPPEVESEGRQMGRGDLISPKISPMIIVVGGSDVADQFELGLIRLE